MLRETKNTSKTKITRKLITHCFTYDVETHFNILCFFFLFCNKDSNLSESYLADCTPRILVLPPKLTDFSIHNFLQGWFYSQFKGYKISKTFEDIFYSVKLETSPSIFRPYHSVLIDVLKVSLSISASRGLNDKKLFSLIKFLVMSCFVLSFL